MNELEQKVRDAFKHDEVTQYIHDITDEKIILNFNKFYYNRIGSESTQKMEELGYRISFFDLDLNVIVFQQIDYDNPKFS